MIDCNIEHVPAIKINFLLDVYQFNMALFYYELINYLKYLYMFYEGLNEFFRFFLKISKNKNIKNVFIIAAKY